MSKFEKIMLIMTTLTMMIITVGAFTSNNAQAEPVPVVTEVTTEVTTEAETDELTTIKFEDIPEYIDLGVFELTAYCSCEACCGKSDGITATGTKVEQGRTVAVDPNVIPYGTKLFINGDTYIAEDTGGAIKGDRVDIYFDSHDEALEFGRQYAKVFEVMN